MKAAEACRGKYLLDSLMLFSDAAARREGINPDLHVCIILQCSVSDVMANNIVVHHILVLFCWKKRQAVVIKTATSSQCNFYVLPGLV